MAHAWALRSERAKRPGGNSAYPMHTGDPSSTERSPPVNTRPIDTLPTGRGVTAYPRERPLPQYELPGRHRTARRPSIYMNSNDAEPVGGSLLTRANLRPRHPSTAPVKHESTDVTLVSEKETSSLPAEFNYEPSSGPIGICAAGDASVRCRPPVDMEIDAPQLPNSGRIAQGSECDPGNVTRSTVLCGAVTLATFRNPFNLCRSSRGP